MSLPPSLSPLGRLVYSLPVFAGQLLTSARGIAFWTAIALPFGYLPLFTIETIQISVETFIVLLVINVVALVLGHPYRG
jgi:hypothetical protein